jgi:hypothetical protein
MRDPTISCRCGSPRGEAVAEAVAYACHGLVVRSDVPIAADLATSAAVPDIEVRMGPTRVVPEELPCGRVLARLVLDGEHLTWLTRSDRGWTVRFPGLADVMIDDDVKRIVVHLDDRVDPGFAAVLVGGTVLGWALRLRGHHVLHASAVSHQGSALAFVADSGGGKSTLAVGCALEGARVITDDLLRVDIEAASCPPGVTALRLRATAERFVSDLEDRAPRLGVSADGRTLVEADRERESRRLGAIVLPLLERDSAAISIRRLALAEALTELTIKVGPEWMDREMRLREFRQRARLVSEVPVFEVTLPWGHGPSAAATGALLELVRDADTRAARNAS